MMYQAHIYIPRLDHPKKQVSETLSHHYNTWDLNGVKVFKPLLSAIVVIVGKELLCFRISLDRIARKGRSLL